MSDQGGDTRIELMFRLEAALKRIEELERTIKQAMRMRQLQYIRANGLQEALQEIHNTADWTLAQAAIAKSRKWQVIDPMLPMPGEAP